MSVQKFIIGNKTSNFTTFTNKVLQGLKNYEALGLYAYLLSLPAGWVFYKEQLAKHGNIGRDKINSLLKILQNHNLIQVSQVRNEKGQFSHFHLDVLDGNDFIINDIEEPEKPFTEKPFTANQLLDNSSYKENINKTNINKNKSFCASPEKSKNQDQKQTNSKKHDWAEKKPPLASVESQSTSYDPNRPASALKVSKHLDDYMRRNAH